MLLDRSAYWQNELHPNGLIQVRTGSGAWKVPLDNPGEGANTDYLAGNAEQYTWMLPYDPRTLLTAIAALSAAALAAAYLPARRAASLNPTAALREE